MPKTDPDPFGPQFGTRLRRALDRIEPVNSAPRYQSIGAAPRMTALRLAPFVLAIGLTGILGLTAWAATGSADPAVWTNRVETVINEGLTNPSPEATPPATQTNAPLPAGPARAVPARPTQRPTPSGDDERESSQPSSAPRLSHSPGVWPSPSPASSPLPHDE